MRKSLFILFFSILTIQAFCQDSPRVVQLTGVVFTPDSLSTIPGVHIYEPTAGRGTTTNVYGFFSMPVLEGDSIVFSAVGFKKRSYIVPEHDSDESLKLIFTMDEDVTFLEEVEIMPFPSEAMFKSAVLAMELPQNQDYAYMQAWLQSQYMAQAYQQLHNSANNNYRYFLSQQQSAQNTRGGQMVSNPLINPFAWAKTIKDLKKKKK